MTVHRRSSDVSICHIESGEVIIVSDEYYIVTDSIKITDSLTEVNCVNLETGELVTFDSNTKFTLTDGAFYEEGC